MSARDNFGLIVVRTLRERVGGRCSRPECGKMTIAPDLLDGNRTINTGVAAHITAAQAGGPRYDKGLSSAARTGAENGIWLCSDCASLIDKNNGRDYPENLLKSWKREAEEVQFNRAKFGHRYVTPAWLERVSAPDYINVPRILLRIGHEAVDPSLLDDLADGFPRGRMIVREIVAAREALLRARVAAIDVEEIGDPATLLQPGMHISFHRSCFTRNGNNVSMEDVRSFNYDRSPLLHFRSGGYRYLFPYDPKWLTSNTAHVHVRSGNHKFAGIAVVRDISHTSKQAICSPLMFGTPNLLF